MKRSARLSFLASLTFAGTPALLAGINEDQVLVIYNSQNADSVAVYNHYVATHPGALGINLNTTFTSSHTIPYAEYVAKIRDPIRNHLNANSLQQQIVVLTPTKGIPHRIDDTDNPGIGDNPVGAGAEAFTNSNADATYATVDSELTLLWRGLNTNEAGGQMDSFSDNFILNPYHAQAQSISNFSRANIVAGKTFVNHANAFWEMRENGGADATDGGDMYLTARLDGNTVAQVNAMVDRAQHLIYNRAGSTIVLDENDANVNGLGWELDDQALFDPQTDDPAYQGPDYEDAFAQMSPRWNVMFNQNNQFLTGASSPGGGFNDPNRVALDANIDVAALISQGGNHSGDSQAGYLDTFANQLVAGAIMNTIESYNARDFGGAGGFTDQGQLSKWIELGGTFGVGHAWEPFAQAIADSEFLLDNFLNQRLTRVEAAWSSIPYVSWQNLVIGDPLAVVTQTGDTDFDGDVDIDDLTTLAGGYGMVTGATWEDGNFDFDGDVDLVDLTLLATYYGGGPSMALADFRALASVPEPATVGVLASMLVLAARRSRRSRCH